MTKTVILGASGYVGGELLRLLSEHPMLDAGPLVAASSAGKAVAELHPHLALAYTVARFEEWDPALLDGAELIFAALPHGESQRLADALIGSGAKVVDLGADFRLNSAAAYADWYGEPHARPDLIGKFVYGLPEFHRAAIAGADLVAAPGCYPTAASLALRPLVEAGAIEITGIIVDAASGASGAGRAPNDGTLYGRVEGNYRAYGLTRHRHTAEIEMMAGAAVLFTPHLMAASRGILATCYATATGRCDPLDILREAYAGETFIHVGETPPETKWASGSNAAFLSARYDERTGKVIALAAIDNLGKGAAGQMIQCANLMLGFDEGAGLSTMGVCP